MKKRTMSLCLGCSLGLFAATAFLTGCAGDNYSRSTGQYIDDKAMAARIHNALNKDPLYKFDDVDVTAFRGTVQLNGFVNTGDQKRKAEEIAKRVEGVEKVENKISVKETAGQSR